MMLIEGREQRNTTIEGQFDDAVESTLRVPASSYRSLPPLPVNPAAFLPSTRIIHVETRKRLVSVDSNLPCHPHEQHTEANTLAQAESIRKRFASTPIDYLLPTWQIPRAHKFTTEDCCPDLVDATPQKTHVERQRRCGGPHHHRNRTNLIPASTGHTPSMQTGTPQQSFQISVSSQKWPSNETENFPRVKQDSEKNFPIEDFELTDEDVLCGRGGMTNTHPGNVAFRAMVEKHRLGYARVKKFEKKEIAIMIVMEVRRKHGRFLKKDECTGFWYEIGDENAKGKASQTLREGQAKMYRESLWASGKDPCVTIEATPMAGEQRKRPCKGQSNNCGIPLPKRARS